MLEMGGVGPMFGQIRSEPFAQLRERVTLRWASLQVADGEGIERRIADRRADERMLFAQTLQEPCPI